MAVNIEKLKKQNAMLENGFSVDINSAFRNEQSVKVSIKDDCDDSVSYIASVHWMPVYETICNEYGARYNRRTGENELQLNIMRYKDEGGGCLVGHGLGQWFSTGIKSNRKVFKSMAQLTHKLDRDFIMSLISVSDLEPHFIHETPADISIASFVNA